MSYFNALAAASFQTADNGDIVWYPWGKWGKGYKVPTSEHRAEIQKWIKTSYIIMMIAIFMIPSLHLDLTIYLIIPLIWCPIYAIYANKQTSRLEISEIPFSMNKYNRRFSTDLGKLG